MLQLWRRTFLRACEDVLGARIDHESVTVEYDDRRTVVTSHPIGIDHSSSTS